MEVLWVYFSGMYIVCIDSVLDIGKSIEKVLRNIVSPYVLIKFGTFLSRMFF